MKLVTKISLTLATVFFGLAFAAAQVEASDELTNCQYVYGGGQICGTHTPVDTGFASDSLFTLSAALYTSGLGSFVIARKADKLGPFLK